MKYLGAGNGLGKEYALELGRRGASVVVNDFGGSVLGAGKSPNLIFDNKKIIVRWINIGSGRSCRRDHRSWWLSQAKLRIRRTCQSNH